LGVLILLLGAPSASMPLLDVRSSRSPDEFGSCFTRAEDGNGSAWSYLPAERGGTFTDSGAGGNRGSYWLRLQSTRAATRVSLFVADGANAAPAHVTRAVVQCR